MARKEIGSIFDRDNRNAMNDNFKELYEDVNKYQSKITDKVYSEIVDSAKLDWKEPVSTYSSLPTTSKIGETRMARDTGKVYRFDGVGWVEIQQIDASPVNEVDRRLSSQLAKRPSQTELLNEFFRKLRYNESVKIVCMGDSLTYGYDIVSVDKRPPEPTPTPSGATHIRERASITYPEALRNYLNMVYPEKITVINRGFSGDRTETSYPKWNENPNSDVTMIMLGTNDSSQDVGVENFLTWYRKIIQREIDWGSAVILLTPPRRRSSDIKGNVFGNAVYRLGEEFGCPVVNMTEMTANMSADNFSDATHFNGKGYDYIGARLASLFIGQGIVNPVKVSSGRTLATREYLDGIKYINDVTAINNAGYPTPDEEALDSGIAMSFSNDVMGKAIYSFYTEEDDMLIYPSMFFSASIIEPIKFTLDFGTESQAVSNTYMYDQDNAAFNRHVPSSVDFYKSDGNWRSAKDVFYINGVKSLDEKKIHVPKRGYHTLMIEGGGIRLHGLDFISFREMRTMAELNKIKFPTWKDAVYENGWTTAGGVNLKYRKEGNFGILYGWITKTPIDTTVVTTLDIGYRPINTQRFPIVFGGTSGIQEANPILNVASNGSVSISNTGSQLSNILIISVVFPVA